MRFKMNMYRTCKIMLHIHNIRIATSATVVLYYIQTVYVIREKENVRITNDYYSSFLSSPISQRQI